MRAPLLVCSACGSANEPGRKFCGECGTRLAVSCPACGSSNAPGARFCGECGSSLGTGAAAAATGVATAAAPIGTEARVAERRLVTVLFADLVGFTTLAEGRDPEHVRELLTRYFDVARDVVERHGGIVEKFIGDAVMVLWGAPVAHEDDAERAVRAALELVDVVRGLGPGLEARGAVLTGEAAVTLGAIGQGMVAGDIVNTMHPFTMKRGIREPLDTFTPDVPENRRSIKKIAELEPSLLLVGHGPPLRDPQALRTLASGLQ